MARYIDADKFTERIKASPAFRNIYDGLLLQRVVIDLLNNMPTADVVPKSEVVLASSDAVKMLMECHGYALTHDADIKEEVAREIFEEIERLCDAHLYWNNCSIIQRDDIAELKKKHIGESDVKRDTV